jgi:hypothetical protein
MQPTISLSTYLLNSLLSSLDKTVANAFADYVVSHQTDRWLIFSDYVLRQPERPTDVFAFTVVPGGSYFNGITTDLKAIAKRDFKDTRHVDEAMLRLLSDPRLFTFCFVLDRSRMLLGKAATVRDILAREIATLSRKEDQAVQKERLRWVRALQRKATANNFSVRLLDDIIFASGLAGLISVLICKSRKAARIGWFSDRDNMTTAHGAIVNYFYQSCTVATCAQEFNGWRGPELGVNAAPDNKQPPWSDVYIRIPDHFAGMISAWNFATDAIPEAPKYQQVLGQAIAGKSNVHVVRLQTERNEEHLSILSQSLTILLK